MAWTSDQIVRRGVYDFDGAYKRTCARAFRIVWSGSARAPGSVRVVQVLSTN